MARTSWFDDTAKHPVIQEKVEKLESFTSALADGVVKLRYAKAGEKARRSWAVIAALPDRAATIGADAGKPALCTAELTVSVDDACRVSATLISRTATAVPEPPRTSSGTEQTTAILTALPVLAGIHG